MASGRRVRRVFEATFISFDTSVGFCRPRQISTQLDASSPHLTPPQASTFMGWRRVVGFVMFSGYFFHDFSWVPDTHHFPSPTDASMAPSTFTMLLYTSDDSEHLGWGVVSVFPPVMDRPPPTLQRSDITIRSHL
jgi:hypothetical protein